MCKNFSQLRCLSFFPSKTFALIRPIKYYPSAWKTEARGGPFLSDRWLKVDLGRVVTLTSVKTQGGTIGGVSGDIASFDLLYSINDALYEMAVPTDEVISVVPKHANKQYQRK